MTRTELLSLAERLDDPRAPAIFLRDAHDAAAILRKLAALLPVAWRMRTGHGVGWRSDEPPEHLKPYWSPLYQLSEVLTDD